MASHYVSDLTGLDAELIMFRNSPENKNCSFLFVEGESDEKFWNSRIQEKGCCIVFVVSFSENNKKKTGKTAVNKNIRTLNRSKIDGFLGVVDADYDGLLQLPLENNIHVTDTHDLETLLLRSPLVFRKLLAEFGDSGLIADFENKVQKKIQDYVLELALPFSKVEWFKQNQIPSLELKSLHKNNTILIREQWCLDQTKLHSFLRDKGLDMYSEKYQTLLGNVECIDPWMLCNGHTMLDILALGFQYGVLGNGMRATSANLAIYIRGAMEAQELHQTELCQSIFDWQNNNTPYKILAL